METIINFDRQKIAASMKLSKELVAELKLSTSTEYEDFVTDTLTARIEAYLYARTKEIKKITVYHKRPTFIQWLFKKPISTDVEIHCLEVFKNPKDSNAPFISLYHTKQL